MSTRRKIPITPDRVSLWRPSGTGRAIDIIRGNDGQVSGAHPNIPAISGSLNTLLGWYFDGTDDCVDLGVRVSLNITTAITISAWAKRNTQDTGDFVLERRGTVTQLNYSFGFYSGNNIQFYYRNSANTAWHKWNSTTTVTDTDWHHIAVSFTYGTGSSIKVYLDGEEIAGSWVTGDGNDAVYDNDAITAQIGDDYVGGNPFNGYVAIPFIAKSVWSVAQINNFYLATKGLFSPRG